MTAGEGVLNRKAMSLLGLQGLAALNSGQIKRYATGGPVGNIAAIPFARGGGDHYAVNVTVNNNGADAKVTNKGQSSTQGMAQANELARQIKAAVLSVLDDQARTGGRGRLVRA